MTAPLSRLTRLARSLRTSQGRQAARSWTPFSITSFEITQRMVQAGYAFDLVIDGGANAGQFARACAMTWPAARVVSFEPLPTLADEAKTNLSDISGRVTVHQVALGPETATVTLHQTPYSLQSSVLKPTSLEFESIEVSQVRLDDVLATADLPPATLLKLDLQGYELAALQGAMATLARVEAVLLEVGFEASYEGEPSFEALRSFLAEHGFAFRRPFDVLWEDGQITQMDALFTRTDA